MVKISELSAIDRRQMVTDISWIMYGYRIDKESVEEFWDTLGMGIEMKKRA